MIFKFFSNHENLFAVLSVMPGTQALYILNKWFVDYIMPQLQDEWCNFSFALIQVYTKASLDHNRHYLHILKN